MTCGLLLSTCSRDPTLPGSFAAFALCELREPVREKDWFWRQEEVGVDDPGRRATGARRLAAAAAAAAAATGAP